MEKDTSKSIPEPLKYGVSFKQVKFRYPGSDRPVLEDFSLHIPSGKITAIVGANGAGKSTLVKLLSRFYDPLAGEVTLDNINLRDLNLQELRRQITVMFQSPVKYADTVAKNIAFGDI